MVSKKAFRAAKRPGARKNNNVDHQNLAYFRLLGLRSGESRVEVIRDAAMSKSIGLQRNSKRDPLEQRQEIAIATYRLLDPRRRSRLMERIQLCYPIDRDEASVPPPHFHVSGGGEPPGLAHSRDVEVIAVLAESPDATTSAVPANDEENDASDPDEDPELPSRRRVGFQDPNADASYRGVPLMQQPVIDRAIDEVLLAPPSVTLRSDSESWMDERREIVRSLKKCETESSQPATSQCSSTLTWLRSVFGL